MSRNESNVEDAALEWFLLRPVRQTKDCGGQTRGLEYAVEHGVYFASYEPAAEPDSFYL